MPVLKRLLCLDAKTSVVCTERSTRVGFVVVGVSRVSLFIRISLAFIFRGVSGSDSKLFFLPLHHFDRTIDGVRLR